MAKIPQGEWSVIAERYSQAASISSIARHYGCTAPAIHYILKRNTISALLCPISDLLSRKPRPTLRPLNRPGLAAARTAGPFRR